MFLQRQKGQIDEVAARPEPEGESGMAVLQEDLRE